MKQNICGARTQNGTACQHIVKDVSKQCAAGHIPRFSKTPLSTPTSDTLRLITDAKRGWWQETNVLLQRSNIFKEDNRELLLWVKSGIENKGQHPTYNVALCLLAQNPGIFSEEAREMLEWMVEKINKNVPTFKPVVGVLAKNPQLFSPEAKPILDWLVEGFKSGNPMFATALLNLAKNPVIFSEEAKEIREWMLQKPTTYQEVADFRSIISTFSCHPSLFTHPEIVCVLALHTGTFVSRMGQSQFEQTVQEVEVGVGCEEFDQAIFKQGLRWSDHLTLDALSASVTQRIEYASPQDCSFLRRLLTKRRDLTTRDKEIINIKLRSFGRKGGSRW